MTYVRVDWSKPVFCIVPECGKKLRKRYDPATEDTVPYGSKFRCKPCTMKAYVFSVSSEYTDTHQKCVNCLEWKVLEDFSRNKNYSSGRISRCNACKLSMYTFKYRLDKYGLTEYQYTQMIEYQQGNCYICQVTPSGMSKGNHLNIDHCHSTGKVRKLLCSPCNLALGHFQDNVERINSAIQYLSRPTIIFPEGVNVLGPSGTNTSGRSVSLYVKYRLRLRGFEWLLDSQDDQCPVCYSQSPQSVDHDHTCCEGARSCGECIRGVLCRGCNAGLGNTRDNVKILETMVDYLTEHASKEGVDIDNGLL